MRAERGTHQITQSLRNSLAASHRLMIKRRSKNTPKMDSLVYKLKKVQLFILLVIFVQQVFSPCWSLSSAQVLRQGCLEKCGDIEIPYPFGTKEGCYLNSDFFMNCAKNLSGSPLLLLRKSKDLEVISISRDGQLRLLTAIAKDCYYPNGTQIKDQDEGASTSLNLISFPISSSQNKFTAVGCDTIAIIQTAKSSTGCISTCNGTQTWNSKDYDGTCSGVGCCQTIIPKHSLNYTTIVRSVNNHTGLADFNPCSYIFVAENNYFNFSQGDLLNLNNITKVPTVLDWAIGKSTCQNITEYPAEYACRENSHCVDAANGPGYRCKCSSGYQGNPYITDGCQDIDECAVTPNPCGDNHCQNMPGTYTCNCNEGYEGNAESKGGCQKVHKTWIEITVGIVVGLAAFLIVGSWFFWGYNKRKHLLLRQKFFIQNGGLMLRKELSCREGYNETAKIFTANELKQATNNFADGRIIGRGGFGTVYKGLLEDGKSIAIKKSKVIDQDQTEQFINEVIVLSQINHRNVVRLIGCCLETEVPLLVYEYVTNGTLHEHIHENKNKPEAISWENRLRIAAEVAGALAYLHSEASVQIVHRDIKCTNILLDDNCTAKVSDFGASRLVPIDQDTLSTMVQGTMGYLDPEYMHTSLLTEKSDVYSFGVVLAELMTGKKALAFDRPEEERCLAMHFILSMKNDDLFSVIEDGLATDGNRKQILEVAKLAQACLRVLGDERPSMRELASELQGILLMGKHLWMDVNIASEENEHLLGCQLLDGYNQSGDTSCNTTGCYGSITDHVVLSVGDGR